jgi:hypothetical protein
MGHRKLNCNVDSSILRQVLERPKERQKRGVILPPPMRPADLETTVGERLCLSLQINFGIDRIVVEVLEK